jgi:hypothetical protein
LAHLHVGRVDPQVRPATFDRPVEERMDPLVDFAAQARDMARRGEARLRLDEMPVIPIALTRSSTERVETPKTAVWSAAACPHSCWRRRYWGKICQSDVDRSS